MKKLSLLLAAFMIAGSAFACDGSKDCCKKGQKGGKACCKKEAAAKADAKADGCEKKGCDKHVAKKDDKQAATASSHTTSSPKK